MVAKVRDEHPRPESTSAFGLYGEPAFRHNEAFSSQVATEDQAEADSYSNAIVESGGTESECGWCRDKWGLSR
jgi:predicted 3-demethylubiquinone-9 3-methyltransferase (glyoxalase superfamily)